MLAANTWAHVAVTYDNLTLRLYVNGVQVATRSQTGATTTSTGALRLGGTALVGPVPQGHPRRRAHLQPRLRVAEIVVDRNTPVSSPDVTAPTSPTNVVATPGGAQVALSWTASTDAVGVAGYDIHRSTVDGFTVGPTTLVGSTAGTTFADGPLAAGTYRYRVVAHDAAGNASTPSAQATATVADDDRADRRHHGAGERYDGHGVAHRRRRRSRRDGRRRCAVPPRRCAARRRGHDEPVRGGVELRRHHRRRPRPHRRRS